MRWRRTRWLLLLAMLATLGWSALVEPRRLVVEEVALTVPTLPAAFAGLRMAALSDLHIGGPHVGIERLATVVARTNEQHADVIVLLGDFLADAPVGDHDPVLERAGPILAKLHAPLGVFAVLGNHDWWYGAAATRRMLTEAKIPVLEHQAFALVSGEARLWLLGIPDFTTRRPRPEQLLEEVAIADGEPIIALTHDPSVFPLVPPRIALTLAGHTHGGQIRLPLVGSPIVPSRYGQRYARGLIEENGHQLFVTTGVGTSVLPLRFGVPPEIAILTLR